MRHLATVEPIIAEPDYISLSCPDQNQSADLARVSAWTYNGNRLKKYLPCKMCHDSIFLFLTKRCIAVRRPTRQYAFQGLFSVKENIEQQMMHDILDLQSLQ